VEIFHSPEMPAHSDQNQQQHVDDLSVSSSSTGGQARGLGYQVREEQKEKEKLKCENYELKMKLYELQRKFNRNSTGAEKSSLNFEYNESKVFEPNSQILDAHKRMIDFNLSHTVSDDEHESINRELYQQLLAEKVQAEEQVRDYQAKVVELESTAENIQNEANLINQKYLYAENQLQKLTPLENFPSFLKQILEIPDSQLLSIDDLKNLIVIKLNESKQMLQSPKNDAPSNENKDERNLITFLTEILNMILLNKNDDSISKMYISEKAMDLKKILTQNSEKFHYVDIPKVFDSIESLSNLDRTKLELTQYPLSNLHADQTELDQTALFSAKEHEATSTPYLSKRVCELRNLAGSVTADLFRSVTEFKSEMSVINGNLSRFSNNFSANSTNINEIDNTGLSAIFDKSDLQYANVNTLILRLEQMVEQFTAMQSELEEKLKIYKDSEEKVVKLDNQIIELKDKIISLTNDLESKKNQILELNANAESIEKALGCPIANVPETIESIKEAVGSLESEIEIKSTELEKCTEEIENLKAEKWSMSDKLDEQQELNNNLQHELEKANNAVKEVEFELDAMRHAQKSHSKIDSSISLNASSNKENIGENPACNEEISSNIQNLKHLSMDDLENHFNEIRNIYQPLFSQNNSVAETLKKINSIKNKTSQIAQSEANHDETLNKNRILIDTLEQKLNEMDVLNSEQKSTISHLNTQILLFKSENEDVKNQMESLRISNSMPQSQENINPKHAEIIVEIQKLQSLLQKSYDNNQSLREFFRKMPSTIPASSADLPKSNNFIDNSAADNSKLGCDQKMKIITDADMNSVEEIIKDSLATLRSLSKFSKVFENVDDIASNKISRKDVMANIYKIKKTIKMLHKNHLKIYRILIHTNLQTEDLSNVTTTTAMSMGGLNLKAFDDPANHSVRTRLSGNTKGLIGVFETLKEADAKITNVEEKMKNVVDEID